MSGGQLSEGFLLAFFVGDRAGGPGGEGVLAIAEYMAQEGTESALPPGFRFLAGPVLVVGRGGGFRHLRHSVHVSGMDSFDS
jgi:hypothetical protein